jgi:hypothetical protein
MHELLEQTVRELKGEDLEDDLRATVTCASTCGSTARACRT